MKKDFNAFDVPSSIRQECIRLRREIDDSLNDDRFDDNLDIVACLLDVAWYLKRAEEIVLEFYSSHVANLSELRSALCKNGLST